MTQYSLIDLCIFSLLAVSDGPPPSSEQQNETAPFKLEATVPSRLALGARCGYSQRCWGSPVRQKKKHTGTNFCIDVNIFYPGCHFLQSSRESTLLLSTLSDSANF